jgi:hypothetical protein
VQAAKPFVTRGSDETNIISMAVHTYDNGNVNFIFENVNIGIKKNQNESLFTAP